MITISRAGFDVQALIPCDSLCALSHSNLDDSHSRGLMVMFVCALSLFCLSLYLHACSSMCLCKCVLRYQLRHLLICGITARLHNGAGVRRHQRLETKTEWLEESFHHCLSVFHLIASRWGVCMCLLYGQKWTRIFDVGFYGTNCLTRY